MSTAHHRIPVFLVVLAFLALQALPAVEIDVPWNAPETALLLWAEKGQTLTFAVKGDWTMWDQWENTGPEGHREYKKINEFYLGTLVACVEGASPFAVTDGQSWQAPVSGLLALYPNRGSYTNLTGRGSLKVNVTSVTETTRQEADKRYGFADNLWPAAQAATWLSADEQAVLVLLNKARTNPALFARLYLKKITPRSDAALECYQEFLKTQAISPLKPSKVLWQSARDHAVDMGKTGRSGHVSSTGATASDRVQRYGSWDQALGENCSYGENSPLAIVLQLLEDDGIPERGHRKNIMSRDFGTAGLSIQVHKTLGWNCVIDFAGSIQSE